MPLAIFIVALLAAGVTVAVVRTGDDMPKAGQSPTPTFTITTASPTTSPTVTTTSPTSPSPTGTVSPTDTATPTESPTETTMSPTSTILPTTPSVIPTTTDGSGLPRTGMPVAGWLIGGLILMVASSALMRALTRAGAA